MWRPVDVPGFFESLATQVLVIFIIRTRGSLLASLPHPLLAASALGVVAVAVALPYPVLGGLFGLMPPPPTLMLALAGMTGIYLVAVEGVKRWFYARNVRG